MSISINTSFHQKLKVSPTAHFLNSMKRQEIGIEAIKGDIPILHMANDHKVSRKFIYQQKEKALNGINQAFKETSSGTENILFNLPITKKWMEQTVLGLIFMCRASYQAVVEFFRDLFDYRISKGNVHNIVYKYLIEAKKINSQQELSRIKVGLHDEIYQAGDPVLVGCCAHSTYCYLLKLVESCDANSWGVHLLDLKEQGLSPDFTVLDGGQPARKGQKEAWPEIPAHSDIFHALKPFLELSAYLDNRAVEAISARDSIYKKFHRRRHLKEYEKHRDLQKKLIAAEQESQKTTALADDIRILYQWLRDDILSLIGPSYADRKGLLNFLIEELLLREKQGVHKIGDLRKYLENHSDSLLEFVPIMEMYFFEIAQEFEVSLSAVWSVYQLKNPALSSQKKWEKGAALRNQLGEKFYWIESLVDKVLNDTVRANSLVENVNSRLRTYFILRKELGNEYLEFLQFFLNHRRFMRSEYEERVGKSPRELMTNKNHKHWLELLGFDLFKQAA